VRDEFNERIDQRLSKVPTSQNFVTSC